MPTIPSWIPSAWALLRVRRRRGSPNGEEEERESDPTAVDDAHEDDGLAPIERDRLERMRRNGEEMRRMGFVDPSTDSQAAPSGTQRHPSKDRARDDVIIIEDDDEDEDGDVNAEEATRDESGIGYGCKRCRFSKRGCYDSMDGKLKGAAATPRWDRCTFSASQARRRRERNRVRSWANPSCLLGPSGGVRHR